MRSVSSYVEIFADERHLPRIEMELVLKEGVIAFSPSLDEVTDMILSVILEVYTSRAPKNVSAHIIDIFAFCFPQLPR